MLYVQDSDAIFFASLGLQGSLRASASKVLGSDLTTEYVKINADYRS